jgi:hypothetical protein
MPHGEYEEAAQGRCRFCGFLSKHARQSAGWPAPRFYEIEHAERMSADGFRRYMAADTEPMCFMGKINLMHILQNEGDAALLEAVNTDRKCDAWYPYMPGLSPKEHYEEFQMQRLENDRRAFELRLSEISQAAQEQSLEIAADSKKIVSDLKMIAEKNDRFSRRVTVWVIILAALQALGAILGLPSVPWVQRLWHYFFG